MTNQEIIAYNQAVFVDDMENYCQLHQYLLEALPNFTHGANTKDSGRVFKETYVALNNKFIRYGTKKAVQVVMFDHDNIAMSLEDYAKWLESKLAIKPTFITQTDKGFQFGFILHNPVFKFTWDKEMNPEYAKLKKLKQEITALIGGDIAGSHRLIGIWRNPLAHKFIFNDKKYSLQTLIEKTPSFDFLELIYNFEFATTTQKTPPPKQPNIKMKLTKKGTIKNWIEAGFYKGNRNNFLFATGFQIVFEDRSTVYSIEQTLLQINASHPNPLTQNEVKDIAKSILQFSPTMHHPKTKTHGKLFEEMQKQGIHGVYNRQAYAGWKTAQTRKEKQSQNIMTSLMKLFEKGKTNPTNSEVTQLSNISIRTYQRFKKTFNPATIFLTWTKELFKSKEIDIKAFVTQFISDVKSVYFGVKKRIEKHKNGEIVVSKLQKSEIMQF